MAATEGRPTILVITGASGFLGRQLVAALQDQFRIVALGRRGPAAVGMAEHPNVRWFQVDIAEELPLWEVLCTVPADDGPVHVIHLAAHYDFTGQEDPEYQRTNVDGLRNVLEACKMLRPVRFYFASSVAACSFPPLGSALTEESPPDGDHVYAVSKRRGEEMVRSYQQSFPSCIVRMAALFSDWCEYPPLYFFLRTWLSGAWNRRVLGGQGESAIPYLHARCAVSFWTRLLQIHERIAPGEVLVASTDGCTSHRELFEAATHACYGSPLRPLLLPRPLARLGLRTIDLLGRFAPERPFERAWMGKYIDQRLAVDARRTRERTGWAPAARRDVLRRMPFLMGNLRADPLEWHRRNLAALNRERVAPNLRLYHLLYAREREMLDASMAHFLDEVTGDLVASYRSRLEREELRWAKQQLFLQLRNSVKHRDNSIFRDYCRHLAERRFRQGFSCEEVCQAFSVERDITLDAIAAARLLDESVDDLIIGTFRVGLDAIEDAYEELSARATGGSGER